MPQQNLIKISDPSTKIQRSHVLLVLNTILDLIAEPETRWLGQKYIRLTISLLVSNSAQSADLDIRDYAQPLLH